MLDGLFIIGLSYLGRDVLPGHPVVVAGLLLSVRYLAEIVLSAVGGDLAERYGAEVLLMGFAVLTSLALVGFGLGWLWTSALAIVILRALLLPLLPPLVARRTPGPGAHPGAGDAVGLAGPGCRCGPGAGGGAPAHCAVRLGVWRRSLAAVGHGHRLLGASRRWISHAAATAPFSQTSALENCP